MRKIRNVPFFKPCIGQEEENAVLDVLRSGWLTTGPKVSEFEKLFAEYTGAKHAVALSSCTAAQHLALELLDLSPEDEIITTPFTFSSTASEILHSGAKIRFVDVLPESGIINPSLIRSAVNEFTRAIIPVHFAGMPCRMDSIFDIALEHNIRIIEDAAHALEARYKNQKIGSLGDFTCFSFYVTKNITTAEGGMLTCDNDDFARKARVLSLHGMSKDAWKRYLPEDKLSSAVQYYQILHQGFKYNMSDIQAALGIEQLKKVELFWEKRDRVVKKYRKALENIPEIELFEEDRDSKNGRHIMVIKLNLSALSITRDQFMEKLKKLGIGCSIHFISLHLHPFYREKYGFSESDFPVAADLSKRVITLPLFPDMSNDDLNHVVKSIKDIIKESKIATLVSVK